MMNNYSTGNKIKSRFYGKMLQEKNIGVCMSINKILPGEKKQLYQQCKKEKDSIVEDRKDHESIDRKKTLKKIERILTRNLNEMSKIRYKR